MGSLIDQVLTLLASDAGSLMYHLVLAFSVAGALQISLNQSQRFHSAQIRRVWLGTGILLAMQLALFIASGLVWQAVIEQRAWLPLLNRSVSLLSLMVIAWLWGFPNPDKISNSASSSSSSSTVDSASLFIGLMTLVGCAFGALWWTRAGFTQALNGSQIDLAFQIACICVAAIGLIILLILRPTLWGYGAATMLLLGAAPVLHLVMLPYGEDYPSLARLFEMAAYPFLLFLPGRAVSQAGMDFIRRPEEIPTALEESGETDQEVVELLTEDRLWKPLFNLMGETDPGQACNKAAAILARTAHADLAIIASPPNPEGKLNILGGYDGRGKRYLPVAKVESSALPALVSCFKLGRMRRLSAESSSPDIAFIMKTYGLEQVGSLLFTPVLMPDGKPMAGVILVTSEAQKGWSPKEQATINLLSKLLVQFLQRMQEAAGLGVEFEQVRQANRATQEQAQQAREEAQKLRDQVTVLQESARQDQDQIMKMAALVAAQTSLQATVDQMKAENEQLQETNQRLLESAASREKPLEGELRMALEEIAFLRTAIANAESEIASLEANPMDGSPSDEQLATLHSIAQDLRQPLSSIVGYTDLLLGESIGILGATQRKYLERIKLSTERFNRLIDDLVQTSMAESNPTRIEREEVDLMAVIHSAIKEADRTIQLRRNVLKIDLPDQPVCIISDLHSLRRVITQLLQNASSATPEGGEIGITARLESSESEMDYTLVQVSDRGGGVALQDIPRVFSPRSQTAGIRGLGKNRVDFLRLKTLVEALGGRTWVDSEPGQGSTFSLLLPSIPEQNDEEDKVEESQ